MSKRKAVELEPASSVDQLEYTTVERAQTHSGEGARIYWRPDGKVNPNEPNNDVAIIIQ